MPDIKELIKQAHKTYDKFAELHANYLYQMIPQFQLNEFVSMLKGKKILEAGCGPGRDVLYFVEEGYEPIGVDKSKNMIKVAKKRVPKGKFQQMDLTDLKFDENEFDGIWCMSALTVLEDDDVKKALHQMYKVLKPKGIIYISVMEGQGQEVINDPRFENSPRYYNKFTPEKIRSLLEKENFKILKIRIDETSHEKTWVEVFAEKN